MQALSIYNPIPQQLAFHQSNAPERLAIGSNRGSKTTVCAVEVAMAVQGRHPYLYYPKDGDNRCVCVAKDQTKIGEVLFRKLFRSGVFDMVRGADGLFRSWVPQVDGYEQSIRKPCLPLIPQRAIKKIAWEKKSINCPKLVTMRNGWEISFYTGLGKPPNGIEASLVWFDEELLAGKEWYEEMSARLMDKKGRFIWSATPQAATEQLFELHEAAMGERGKPLPRIEEFHFLLDDNPFIDPAEIAKFKAKAETDPDNYKVRVKGEFLVTSHRVYSEFNERQHCCDSFNIPSDWCRYMVVDPGYAKPAALFCAVPPSGTVLDGRRIDDQVFIYDEFYIRQSTAKDFAENIYPKVQGVNFEAFLIDAHGSRRTESNGKSIGQQFAEEFAKKQIRSIATGSYFILIGANQEQFGRNQLRTQISQVRQWLWEREDGTSKLQVFRDRCPNFIGEMKRYKNKTDKGKPLEEPDARQWSEGPDCLRYFVLYGVPYVKPKKPKPATPPIVAYSKKIRKKRQGDGNYVLLGPKPSTED